MNSNDILIILVIKLMRLLLKSRTKAQIENMKHVYINIKQFIKTLSWPALLHCFCVISVPNFLKA